MCAKIKKFRMVINLLIPVEISWNNFCFQSFDDMEARQSWRLSPDVYLQKKFWWWIRWINAKHRVTPSFTFQFMAQSKDDAWCHPVSQLIFLQIRTPVSLFLVICTSHYVFISYIVSSTWKFLDMKENLKVLLIWRYVQYYIIKVSRRDSWDIVWLCNSLLYKASSMRYLVNKGERCCQLWSQGNQYFVTNLESRVPR